MAIDIASALRAYSSAPKPTGIDGGEEAQAGGFGAALELVDVVTAVANAETTLETVVALRDRMISAYQDIMRMPV